MPDTTEREPLAEAFFRLRVEAPHEIAVPGIAAARRTVTRRRTARIAALAVLLVAGLAGVGYVGGFVRGGGANPAQPSPSASTSAGPTLSEEALQKLGVDALAKLGYKRGSTRPGMIFGPVTASGSGFTYGVGTSQPLPRGTYRLTAVCLGQGSVEVRWTASGKSGSIIATCGAGVTQMSSLELATAGAITLSLTGDDQANGRAGVAVAVTDPLVVAAKTALGAAPAGILLGSEGVADSPKMDTDESGAPSGSYKLVVTCAGAGTLTATFTIGTATTTGTVRCSASPGRTNLQLNVPNGGAQLTVKLDPDAGALGKAGFAYQVLKA